MKRFLVLLIPAVLVGAIVLVTVLVPQPSSEEGMSLGTAVGNRAPSFTVETIDGQRVSLADFNREKALVITSTASWCPTCVIEAENFSEVYEEYRDRAEFLSVSVDPTDDRLKLESFRVNTNSPWLYTEPSREGVRQMIIDYAITRFEITYVIDPKGIVRFRDTGITSRDTLREALENALAT